MRVRKKKWTDSELETNPRVIKNNYDQKGSWNKYFGNDNPIYLEIGSGKGKFINTTASITPNINFIALEKQPHVISSASRESRELDENIKLVFIIDNVTSLEDIFAENELSRLYINFCDPWSRKNKWHKRRLTDRSFLARYKILLKEKGEIFFKTDNTPLFESALNEFSYENWMLKNISLDLHNSNFEGNIKTEYEEKFSGKGFTIKRLEAINQK